MEWRISTPNWWLSKNEITDEVNDYQINDYQINEIDDNEEDQIDDTIIVNEIV